MATGAGGVSFLSNLPPDQYAMVPSLFNQSTERQDIPQATSEWKGFGTTLQVRLQNVGVIALVKLAFELSYKGSAAVAAGLVQPGFPYNIVKRVALLANGQTALINVKGTTLRARRQRIFRNPAEGLEEVTSTFAASTSYKAKFLLDLPVAHDMYSLLGVLLAQNPATYLSLEIVFATPSEVFGYSAGGPEAESGTVYTEMTTFAVGQASVGGKTKTILPDLTVFHGMLDNTFSIAATGITQAPLIRVAGQLVNYGFNVRNGAASAGAEIKQFNPNTALTEIAFKYGGNRQPRVYTPTAFLLDANQEAYNGLVEIGPAGKKVTYTYLDFEVDNAARDLFLPEMLVELQAQIAIASGETVYQGANLLYQEESLYPAV